ncbi:MAG: hypothetical protein PHC91_01455 [Eubacteriales bacterium]|nr:hypothetical protein [Eubacteriales bacterium]
MLKIGGNLIILGQPLSSFLLCAFIGLCAGSAIGLLICRRRNLPRSFVFRMVTLILFFAFLAEVLVNKIPDAALPFSYISGLFVATMLFYLSGKVFHYNPRHCCEIGLISVNAYMIFSKLGCFFAGCCHGNPYDGFFTVVYTENSHALLQTVPLFPIQLVEALVRAGVLYLMIILYYKDYFYRYRIPLFLVLLGNSYFWGMLFWYDEVKLINRSGTDYILIFNILFGIGTFTCVILHLSDKMRKEFNKSPQKNCISCELRRLDNE